MQRVFIYSYGHLSTFKYKHKEITKNHWKKNTHPLRKIKQHRMSKKSFEHKKPLPEVHKFNPDPTKNRLTCPYLRIFHEKVKNIRVFSILELNDSYFTLFERFL